MKEWHQKINSKNKTATNCIKTKETKFKRIQNNKKLTEYIEWNKISKEPKENRIQKEGETNGNISNY